MRDIPAGAIIDGRYRVVGRLGSGGMADVYCAEDTHLGRKVALKVLYRRFAQDAEFVERFRREAKAAAGLQHPNVVSVYDRGQHDGTYYIAMEYLTGRSLKDIITEQGALEPRRAVEIAKQILAAVSFAHRHDIIHRDIKPHNVIVSAEGRVKVTDFGIARAGASDVTETGSILGTAQYLAPEQAQGQSVTAASDLYSVGVLLYEMLTGEVPFEGDSAVAVALKHVSEEPRPLRQLEPRVPEALERVVLRALAKQPEERFPDAPAFAAALASAMAGEESQTAAEQTAAFEPVAPGPTELAAQPLPPEARLIDRAQPEHAAPARRRWSKRRWIVLAVLLLVGIGGGAAAFVLLKTPEVQVPAVVGKPLGDARLELEQRDFKVDIRRVTNLAAVDTVLEQSPLAGSKMDKGSTVLLTVSKGPETTQVPDVADVEEKVAKKRLKKAKLKVVREEQNSTDVEAGLVIKTDPAAGETVPVDSRVTVVVSLGPKQVEVPGVIGLGKDTAVGDVKSVGLDVVIEEVDSEKPKGEVTAQSPSGGTMVDEGGSVTLEVSNGSQRAEVPDVVGLAIDSASSRIEDADLSVSVKEEAVDDVAKDGIVLDQSPAGGKQAKKGDRVTITVGNFEPSIPPEGGGPGSP